MNPERTPGLTILERPPEQSEFLRMPLDIATDQYPLLNPSWVEQTCFTCKQMSLKELKEQLEEDPRWENVKPEEKRKFENVFRDSHTPEELLFYCNLRLIYKQARKYYRPSSKLTLNDLIQDGVPGLMKALAEFDPTKEVKDPHHPEEPPHRGKFSTYATWWVRQAIDRAIGNTANTIRISVYIQEDATNIDQITREFEIEQGRSPTKEELKKRFQQETGLSEKRFENAIRARQLKNSGLVSLDRGVKEEEDSDSFATLIPGPEDTEKEAIRNLIREEIRKAVADAGLTPREIQILELRFGQDLTLENTGQQLESELSRERVRQIQKKVLGELAKSPALRKIYENI